MSRPPVSLQTRLIAASAVLALLVIGVFIALVFAASAARTATNEEARSKNVTASALQLQKLVLDLETGVARLRPHRRHQSSWSPTRRRGRAAQGQARPGSHDK